MTRSSVHWWAPTHASWWIAALFVVGAGCFALGALPVYADWAGLDATAVTFFVGSLFFTSAAALQLLVGVGALPPDGHRDPPGIRWCELRPGDDRAAWWAGVVQLAGTLFFNVSTWAALQQGLTATQADRTVWTPDRWGSIAFLVASTLAFGAVARPWLTWRPHDLTWSIATLNLLGSLAFAVSAVASFVVVSTDTLRDAQRANLGTFVGALCFLVGAALLVPQQSADPARISSR